MSREAAKKIRMADPAERQKMAETMAEFLNTASLLLAESPVLREAFANVHSQFLNFPESAGTIHDALSAYDRFISTKNREGSYHKESLEAFSLSQER